MVSRWSRTGLVPDLHSIALSVSWNTPWARKLGSTWILDAKLWSSRSQGAAMGGREEKAVCRSPTCRRANLVRLSNQTTLHGTWRCMQNGFSRLPDFLRSDVDRLGASRVVFVGSCDISRKNLSPRIGESSRCVRSEQSIGRIVSMNARVSSDIRATIRETTLKMCENWLDRTARWKSSSEAREIKRRLNAKRNGTKRNLAGVFTADDCANESIWQFILGKSCNVMGFRVNIYSEIQRDSE